MKFAEIGPVESSRTCMSSDGPVGLGLTSLTPEESPLETLMGKAKILLAKYMRLPEHPDGSWIMMSEDIPHFSKVSAFPIDLFFTPAFKVGLITEQDRGAIERIALDLPSKAYPKLKIISELLTTLLSNQGIVEELSSKAAAWGIQVPDNFSSLADTTAGSSSIAGFEGCAIH